MSEKINLDVDTTEAERKIDSLNDKIEDTVEKATEATEAVENEAEKSFNNVMGMMRSSYMIMSGVGRIMGGTMGKMFSGLYSLAISSIMTYKAIAAAVAATPGGQVQAAIMFASLSIAAANLGATIGKQKEFSRGLSGLNTSLHGISGMIDSFSI